MEGYEDYEMKDISLKYPKYDNYDDDDLFDAFNSSLDLDSPSNEDISITNYLYQLLESRGYDPITENRRSLTHNLFSDDTVAETSFTENVDADNRGGSTIGIQGRTDTLRSRTEENRGTKRKRQPEQESADLTHYRRPENLITRSVETFISMFYKKPGFKFDGRSDSEIQLRNRSYRFCFGSKHRQ